MPSSYPENFSDIVKTIVRVNPKTVLDIGPGRGKYGLACKEYVGEIKVDALEVFEPYITPRLKAIYDNVYLGNVLEKEPAAYDLYLLIDIVEHWPIEDGLKLIRRLLKWGKVLVSTPRAEIPQEAVNGNEWERHVSSWNGFNFDEFPHEQIPNQVSFIYLLG